MKFEEPEEEEIEPEEETIQVQDEEQDEVEHEDVFCSPEDKAREANKNKTMLV